MMLRPGCSLVLRAPRRLLRCQRVLNVFGKDSSTTIYQSQHQHFYRPYSRTSSLFEDGGEEAAAAEKTKEELYQEKILRKMAAQSFNNRRAAYKRQVSALRKQYAEEIAEQRAADRAEQEARARQLTRQRLERQRKKNLRSAQHALQQEAIRLERAKEFEQHLRVMQQEREAKEARFAKARQLVIDELEQEAPLWLTTPEEVEAAFTPEAEQLLWARPGGVLGAPNPSLDCHFWQYETHTWHMNRTYKSQRQVLLEELEEAIYNEANIDKSFWTEERLEERRKLEEKARLRAMVHSAGRAELLRRQRLMLEEEVVNTTDGDGAGNDFPKPVPAPNLRVLQDDVALEREGARLLMQDPTKFFVFDNAPASDGTSAEDATDLDQSLSSSDYHGPALGAPIDLRDPLREGSHQNRVFPYVIGRIPKPDTRTEREKKQQEREERLLAAAQAEAQADMDIEMAAQQQTFEDLQPDLNYDELEWDQDEEEWKKGLDPVADSDILETPREHRYSQDDIEWVVDRLEAQLKHLEQQFGQEVEGLKQSVASEARLAAGKDDPFEPGSLEAAILSLSEKELLKLSDLQDRYKEGESLDDLLAVVEDEVPGLSREQASEVLERCK